MLKYSPNPSKLCRYRVCCEEYAQSNESQKNYNEKKQYLIFTIYENIHKTYEYFAITWRGAKLQSG